MRESTEVMIQVPAAQRVDWEIVDMTGVRKQSGSLSEGNGPIHFFIDRNDLESGSYLLIVTSKEKSYQRILMVK